MEEREPCALLVVISIGRTTYGKHYGGSSKNKKKTELPHDSPMPFLDIYPKQRKQDLQGISECFCSL